MRNMETKLFTELRPLYETTKENPHVIRLKIRMKDAIDPDVLRYAVDITMRRYPYLCVELTKKDGQYIFIDNDRPVVITNSLRGVDLNSPEANYHVIAFVYEDDWLALDVFHGITDGTGSYEVLKTLLYYYCTEKYNVALSTNGVRLEEDDVRPEEWEEPIANRKDLPTSEKAQQSDALNLVAAAGLENDKQNTVYSIVIDESEYMEFVKGNGGSPTTMTALLLSRAVSRMYPDAEQVIRMMVCVNQRNALKVPMARHSLVGGASLEYNDNISSLPISKQARIFREMLNKEITDEEVLKGVAAQRALYNMILSKETDQERTKLAKMLGDVMIRAITSIVSYVGRTDFNGAERYIRDFRTLTSPPPIGLGVEIAAVGGRFTLDFIQTFSSDIYVNAFLKELEENNIRIELQEVSRLEIPDFKHPW